VKLKTGLLKQPGKVSGRSINKRGKDCHTLSCTEIEREHTESKVFELMILAIV